MTTKRRPYRPSCGSEGADFQARFCAYCVHDQDWEQGNGCPIILDTMLYEVDDPDYPSQWIWGDNGPECTAFQPVEEAPERSERCALTIDMFEFTDARG